MPDAHQLFLRSRGLYEADPRVELCFYFTTLLTQFSRRWRNRLNEKLAEIGQTQARLESLFWIEVSEGRATQRELADRVGIEGPTLARMLDRLEEEGLVERRSSSGDRRTKTIALKKCAVPFLKQMREVTDQLRAEILQDVASYELSACVSLMRTLLPKLERR
jgi:MarR family transcriptional regulator, transcriptional regulator for hemolysin